MLALALLVQPPALLGHAGGPATHHANTLPCPAASGMAPEHAHGGDCGESGAALGLACCVLGHCPALAALPLPPLVQPSPLLGMAVLVPIGAPTLDGVAVDPTLPPPRRPA